MLLTEICLCRLQQKDPVGQLAEILLSSVRSRAHTPLMMDVGLIQSNFKVVLRRDLICSLLLLGTTSIICPAWLICDKSKNRRWSEFRHVTPRIEILNKVAKRNIGVKKKKIDLLAIRILNTCKQYKLISS
ncbi:hypothetical protein AVEN_136933-1 [Araneus ventricosus]|uniref:Uncharacterized protein n=1 Tax=Araneus ventricosus TaxID=182803 RepID=A0A4Y2BJ93_ARAVE|nr:hypothetical protein AVEN_136933-1 [Araneus ventricosus]